MTPVLEAEWEAGLGGRKGHPHLPQQPAGQLRVVRTLGTSCLVTNPIP